MLISFPSDEYDMSIEMTDDGARIFFHMCTVRAAAGEPIAVRLMYRLLLDGARRSELSQYGDVAAHLRRQLAAEFGTDPRAVSDDARMVPDFPTEEEFDRALEVLFPAEEARSAFYTGDWRSKLRNAEAIAAYRANQGKDEM